MTTTHPVFARPPFSLPPTTPGRDADLYLLPIFGAEGGYNDEGGVRVNQTADGVNLNAIWDEVAALTAVYNEKRDKMASLISYPTVAIADPVVQSIGSESFERASEYGVPTGIRSGAEPLLMGYDFEDWDKATRFTWKFLRDASAEQVRNVISQAIDADNKLVNNQILDRLFNPEERLSPESHRVFGLWTGTDNLGPLPFLGKTFPKTTSHYVASGSPVIDSGDIEDAMRLVTEKGYGAGRGAQLLILCHPDEAEAIQTFRKGFPSRPALSGETEGPIAKHDFIPSATAPAYLTDENIVGKVAPGEFGGLEVLGSYGPAWLIGSYFVPAGYVAVLASGGPNSPDNPVAFRSHKNPAYQGLRVIPGMGRYPLTESFFARGCGTGVRHRGAAAVIQVTIGTTYAAPVIQW